jgi:hypothetical protein
MPAWIDLVVAGFLGLLGAALAWLELRRRPEIAAAEASSRAYLQGRLRRRIRVAVLLGMLAAIIVGARWIDPDRRPVPYLLIWFVATVVALRLMWLGLVDYLAARIHWVGRTTRNLVDIARTRVELRELESRRRNGRDHD